MTRTVEIYVMAEWKLLFSPEQNILAHIECIFICNPDLVLHSAHYNLFSLVVFHLKCLHRESTPEIELFMRNITIH